MLLAVFFAVLASAGRAVGGGVDVEWRDLTFKVKSKSKSKEILSSVHGCARSGRILAIMGPSGSGKTSLLNALAGQVRATKGASLTGTLLVDGAPVRSVSEERRTAYVKQEDVFYAQMTVRAAALPFAGLARARGSATALAPSYAARCARPRAPAHKCVAAAMG